MKKIIKYLVILTLILATSGFVLLSAPSLAMKNRFNNMREELQLDLGMDLENFKKILRKKGHSEDSINRMKVSDYATLPGDVGSQHEKKYEGPPCYSIEIPKVSWDLLGLSSFNSKSELLVAFDENQKIRYQGEVTDSTFQYGCGYPRWW